MAFGSSILNFYPERKMNKNEKIPPALAEDKIRQIGSQVCIAELIRRSNFTDAGNGKLIWLDSGATVLSVAAEPLHAVPAFAAHRQCLLIKCQSVSANSETTDNLPIKARNLPIWNLTPRS